MVCFKKCVVCVMDSLWCVLRDVCFVRVCVMAGLWVF